MSLTKAVPSPGKLVPTWAGIKAHLFCTIHALLSEKGIILMPFIFVDFAE
jgi:hypothetical protein